MNKVLKQFDSPFNSHIEIGLRLLCLLTAAYPKSYSIQQLACFDYMLIHSDDLPEGPVGIHPQTPQRSGEYLVRRNDLSTTLKIFISRGLIAEHYKNKGLMYAATEASAPFLDRLAAEYTSRLREYALWVADTYGNVSEPDLNRLMIQNFKQWGGNSNRYSEILRER
jgi:hypothetical protein